MGINKVMDLKALCKIATYSAHEVPLSAVRRFPSLQAAAIEPSAV